jgi:hypothetical protein
MLIKVLEQVFLDNSYVMSPILEDNIDYTGFLAFPNKEKNRDEYFLLIEHIAPSDEVLYDLIEQDADTFYELLNNSKETDETFKKNCTMILCCKSSVSETAVLLVEEDPYNFKKNVIVYSIDELDSWNEKVDQPFTVEKLNILINKNNSERFHKFKEGKRSDYYSLLMKIITKLPFIIFLLPNKDLYNLEKKIESVLPRSEQKILNFILSVDLDESDDEFCRNLLSGWEATDA